MQPPLRGDRLHLPQFEYGSRGRRRPGTGGTSGAAAPWTLPAATARLSGAMIAERLSQVTGSRYGSGYRTVACHSVRAGTPCGMGGMRNTGTKSHGSDWPTSHPTVPMQVSVGTPRRQPRLCRRRSPSTADRLPTAARSAGQGHELVEPRQVREQWVWVGWRCRKLREAATGAPSTVTFRSGVPRTP